MEINSFWNNKKVYITGATGLVGSNLVDKLLKLGATVYALVWDQPGNSELVLSKNIEKIKVFHGDLSNKEIVHESILNSRAEYVFHLGAQTIVSKAFHDPEETFRTNILGTWNILEGIRKNSQYITGAVVASSDKAYGNTDQLPYVETHPVQGIAPYDVSKSCTDLLAQSYAKTYNLPINIARCANIYGPGDTNWSRIVPGTLKSIFIDKTTPVLRSNGTFLRDYIYVQDVVDAFLLLASASSKISAGSAYNFSTDRASTVMEIYEEICAATVGKYVKPIILNNVHNEIQEQHMNSAKAFQELGWVAKTTLSHGLLKTAEWYKTLSEINWLDVK